MSKIPFITVGNGELDENESIGKSEVCPNCGKKHKVGYGETIHKDGTRTPSKSLAFIKCGDKSYLVGIDGKALRRQKVEKFV